MGYSQIDFKKNCTFSSTLRNFEYKPPEEVNANDSINEEICQS